MARSDPSFCLIILKDASTITAVRVGMVHINAWLGLVSSLFFLFYVSYTTILHNDAGLLAIGQG